VGLDALLVGYYEATKLQFAGKVRAGFTPHIRRELVARLKPLATSTCPFANLPDAGTGHWGGGITAQQMREMQWARPELVAQIRFTEWTADSRLRHAAFLGLRFDKAASEVHREA
jgi:bifunctional non-homologous end joining protein LigD